MLGSGNFERRQQLIQCSANSFLRAENSEIDNALSEIFKVQKGRIITLEFTPAGEERVYNFMEENSLLLEANMLMEQPVQVERLVLHRAHAGSLRDWVKTRTAE